jgi:hypothetical protein
VPTDGLVAWYRGPTDLSGNGNDLSVLGTVTTVPDRFGNPNEAPYFDGNPSSDFIQGTNPLLPVGGSPRTISVWFQTSADYVGAGVGGSIYSYGTTAFGERFGFLVSQDSNDDYFVGQFADVPGPVVVNDGKWHNAIVVWDGSTETTYVDAHYSVSGNPVLSTLGTTLTIGASNWDHTPEPYTGAIDDLRIYERVLTEDERGALYLEGGW